MAKNGIFKRISKQINSVYTKALIFGGRKLNRRTYSNLLKKHPHAPFKSEERYNDLWKKFGKKPDIKSYRLFAQYIGENPEIVPEDISSGIILPLLNPIEYRPYYQDKNMFDKILGEDKMPTTLLRSINGSYYTKDYTPLIDLENALELITANETSVFLKPSVDSSSGEGVIGFKRDKEGKLVSLEDGRKLDQAFLNTYRELEPDFILQRGLTQHPGVALFNPSSINTIRVATYRSVVDNKPHFLRAIIRIGKVGSFVDNAHAGGLFVGVDENGVLGKYACDQYGNKYEEFNGINFANNEYQIPNFDRIVDFSKEIASKVVHARLLAQDICLEENGEPKLVEFNLRAYSSWLFQFTSGTAFGDFTQEIIDYCAPRIKDVRKVFVEPF